MKVEKPDKEGSKECMQGWLSVDPLAGKYPSLSPYAYCADNPVIVIDPDGKDIIIVIASTDNNLEIKKYNSGAILNQISSCPMGETLIQKYINNKDEDVYITIGSVGANSMGRTDRAFDRNGNLTTPVTIDIGSQSFIGHNKDENGNPALTDFQYISIDKNKKNYFITIDENIYGIKKIDSDIKRKEGAKVLGHEMFSHLVDRLESYNGEEHDKWGQKEYGRFNALFGSPAQKFNKEVDNTLRASNKYNLNKIGYGKYKLQENIK